MRTSIVEIRGVGGAVVLRYTPRNHTAAYGPPNTMAHTAGAVQRGQRRRRHTVRREVA